MTSPPVVGQTVTVPVEPTPEMTRAGWNAYLSDMKGGMERFAITYRAMIAARPQRQKAETAAPSDLNESEREELLRLRALINTPQTGDWLAAVELEAAHQQERWGSDHDAGKEPQDWFWLLGYLGGKALASFSKGDREKGLHHTISSAAALLNWHRAESGIATRMRPGIAEQEPASQGA